MNGFRSRCLIPALMVHSFHGNGRMRYGTGSHGSATTTEAVRRAIQHSQESLRALAKRYGINQKTVAKWKKRSSVADLPTGPREPKSTVLYGRGGSHHRRLPAAYAAAARRLPLCAPADDPAPDALIPASLPAAARHLPAAGRGRRQAGKKKFKTLSDRLLPHRHRRGAHGRGQALSVRGHRPDLQVRLRRAAREGDDRCLQRVPRA